MSEVLVGGCPECGHAIVGSIQDGPGFTPVPCEGCGQTLLVTECPRPLALSVQDLLVIGYLRAGASFSDAADMAEVSVNPSKRLAMRMHLMAPGSDSALSADVLAAIEELEARHRSCREPAASALV